MNRPEIKPTREADMQTALKAIQNIQHGAQIEEWQPCLDLLADTITFYVLVPGFADRGLLRGKDQAVNLFAHHTSVTRTE